MTHYIRGRKNALVTWVTQLKTLKWYTLVIAVSSFHVGSTTIGTDPHAPNRGKVLMTCLNRKPATKVLILKLDIEERINWT